MTHRNDTVDEINAYTISKTDGEARDYYSYDSFEVSETQSNQNDTLYAIEYLNSMEFPGLPSQKLTLKVSAPIMLLRNINKKKGLYNGTRMILTHIGDHVLKAKIITGSHIGEEVLIPRIVLLYDETKLRSHYVGGNSLSDCVMQCNQQKPRPKSKRCHLIFA